VCVRRCAASLEAVVKALSQSAHWCGRRPVCVSVCVAKFTACENALPHVCARPCAHQGPRRGHESVRSGGVV
jgi:hypothetical protein